MPKRFRLRGCTIEVVDNIDQWHGPNYRYFKFKGDDGNLYILRLDEARAEWEHYDVPESASRGLCEADLTCGLTSCPS